MRDSLREAHAPLAWQCRFTGLEVPAPPWACHDFGKGQTYADNQVEHLPREAAFAEGSDACTCSGRFVARVAAEGKVPPDATDHPR